MGTPVDARHIANADGDFAPQTQDGWIIEISNLEEDDSELIRLSVQSGNLPTEMNDVMVIPHGNSEAKFAGKGHFEDVPFVIKDWVDRKVRQALIRWRRLVWDPETGVIRLPSVYKRRAEIILQAQDGTRNCSAMLKGAWPSSLNPGVIDHSSSDQILIEMTITYDRAKWSF